MTCDNQLPALSSCSLILDVAHADLKRTTDFSAQSFLRRTADSTSTPMIATTSLTFCGSCDSVSRTVSDH